MKEDEDSHAAEMVARESGVTALLEMSESSTCIQPSTKKVMVQTEISAFLLTEYSFKCNDSAVKFYTGLPGYPTLTAVFDLASDGLENYRHSLLSPFQEFQLTLMKVTETMPSNFRQDFKRCVCIIDCFEVFCERPSDLMAWAQTFSNYKHHNIVKFLIAITPQGVVSFVSKGCGGRFSDKYLTENCGLLNYLLFLM